LTVNTVGSGSVAKSPNQPTYYLNDVVQLTANPASGWIFDHWSGDLSGSVNPATILIDGDKVVTAVFTAPASIIVVSGFPSSVTAGTAGSVTVTAKDAFGNTATGYRGKVHFTSSDAQAILPADYEFTQSDAGTHTFVNGITLKTAGIRYVTATDTVTGSITGTQSGITVLAASASKLVYTTGSSQTLTAGLISSQITVQRQDAYGNPVTSGSARVNLKSGSKGGAFYSNAAGTTRITYVTISGGSSTASFWYSDTISGTPVLTLSATGLTSATTTFTINAAAASKLAYIAGAGQSLQRGRLSSVITVQRQDQYGNPVTSGVTTVSLSSTSAGATFYSDAGTTVVTSVTINAGSSTVSFWYRDTVAGTPTLTASAAGLTSATTKFRIR
jgi:Divergent InlB B-repeat domain